MKTPRVGLLPDSAEGDVFAVLIFNEDEKKWWYAVAPDQLIDVAADDADRVIELGTHDAECPQCGAAIRALLAE